MPTKGIVDQQRLIETALVRGVAGIAISPIDAKNQVDLINQAAKQSKVVTHDSDAPDSQRLCFIGMDNYKAGREAGKLVKEALPEGGKIMIFVGRLEQLNAQQRRQGVIDELMDKPVQSPTASNTIRPATRSKVPVAPSSARAPTTLITRAQGERPGCNDRLSRSRLHGWSVRIQYSRMSRSCERSQEDRQDQAG